MIRRLRIERFKSVVKLDVELGRVNIFIGANGSGKSNLLEAVGVLGAATFGRIEDETLLRRGVRPGVPRLYKTGFKIKGRGNVSDIGFGAVADTGEQYDIALRNPIKNPNPAWIYKWEKYRRGNGEEIVSRGLPNYRKYNPEQGLVALKTVELDPSDTALQFVELLRSYAIYCPNTPGLRGLVPDVQTREPVGLSGGRLPEAIQELILHARQNHTIQPVLNEILDLIGWASSFGTGMSGQLPLSPSAARSAKVVRFRDRFMAKDRNVLTGYDASEGALYILFCAVLAVHPRAPRCLAIDNFDQALNPLLARKLTEAICRWTLQGSTKQWLLTAHNPAVLDGIPLKDPEIRLFAVDRDNKGHTVVNRIDTIKANEALMKHGQDWTLSRLWMNGFLGGVPNV